MSEKKQMNGSPARLGRLVGLLAFVILVAVVCLLLLGSPLRAAPDRSLFEQSTLTLTNTTTPTATLGPGKRVQIPHIDKGEGWDTRIQAQNVGGAQTGVITLFWGGYSGQCAGSEPGPVAHLCHRISDSWGIWPVGSQIPAEAKSAIVYSVSDDVFQAACDAAGTIDSSEAWITWEATYAYSGEPLAVTVNRLVYNGSSASGMYNGFSETMLGSGASYQYFAPYIMHGYDNLDSTLTIQNSGDYPTSIWLYYKEEDNCEFMTAQHVECLAPGEAIRIGPGPDADMPFRSPELDAPWLGSAYISANVPLAIVVDQWDADATMLLTHAGVPYPEYGTTTNYTSLIYREISGWDAEIHVQNSTQNSMPTFVTVEFFDQSGDSILFVGTWICRNGTHTFRLSDIIDLGVNFPFGYVGAAEIKSHKQVDYPGESHGDGEPIVTVVDIKRTKIWDPDLGIWRPAVAGEPQGGAYNVFTPQQVTGATTFALPLIYKQSQATSRIAIRNNSNCNKIKSKIWIWNETGMNVGIIDIPWLHPKHLKIIDLAYQGWLPAGFAGAATFEVLEVEQLCDLDGDGHVDDEPIMPSVMVLNYDDNPDGSASGQEAFPIKDGPAVVVTVVKMTPFSPVKAETVEFEVTFPEQMNTAVAPTVTIGMDAPYTDYTIAPETDAGYTNGYLDSDPTKWYGTYTFTDTMGDGMYHISIAGAEDSAGNPIATNTRNVFILDTVPPSSSVTDLPTYQSNPFSVSWSGSDATSGIASYDIQSRDGTGVSWEDWQTGAVATSTAFVGEDGHTYYFQSRARDNAGNVEAYPGGDGDTHTTVDATAPDGTISIEDDATYVNTTVVILTLSAEDSLSGVSQMSFSNDETNWSGWEAYGISKSWTLASGDGTKTVYVRYKDDAGNIATYSDTIILDTTPPSSAVEALATYQVNISFAVSWSGSDALAGLASYDVQYRDGAGGTWVDWKMATTDTSATFTGSDGQTYYFQCRARDNLSNLEAYPGGDGDTHTTVDATPPTGSILVNDGAVDTTSTNVTLRLSASDGVSGVSQMSFSNDGSSYSDWESYTTSKSWTLASGDGGKTIYVRYRDNAGNISVYTDTINLDTTVQPEYGLSINEGALFTNQITVTLTLPANPHTAQIIVSNDGGFAGAQWEPYATHKEWQITQYGDYVIPRIVYAKYKDTAGVISSVYQDDIILDVTAPSSSITNLSQMEASSSAKMSALASSTVQVAVEWEGSDDVSGVKWYDVQYKQGSAGSWTDWLTRTTQTSATFNATSGYTYYFQSRAEDNAGNWEDYPGGDGDVHLCVLYGDFDPNGRVDVADIMLVAAKWRMTADDLEWEARYDLDGDGIITVVDIMKVVAHWGETCE